MHRLTLRLIIKILFCILITGTVVSCIGLGTPHKMQYLISRNYLATMGLNRSSEMIDLKNNEPVKAIHIGSKNDTLVNNFMLFSQKGDLLSVSKEKEGRVIYNLVEFKYDSKGKLNWIVPNVEYFTTLDYDSLNVIYKMSTPVNIVALKDGSPKWTTELYFDDKNEEYLFMRKGNNNMELFDFYRFSAGKIQAEYHRNREGDMHTDSITYIYKNNKLVQRQGVFDESFFYTTTYDEWERPKLNVTRFSRADSVAWTDTYLYSIDDRIPHTVITTSPLGWKEETNYQVEK